MHSEQEYYYGRIGKAKGDVIDNPGKHIPNFVPAIQNGRIRSRTNTSRSDATLRIVQKQISTANPRPSPASLNERTPTTSCSPKNYLPSTHPRVPAKLSCARRAVPIVS